MAVTAAELDALTGPDQRGRALAQAGAAGVVIGVVTIVVGGSLVGVALAGEALVGGGLVAAVTAIARSRRRRIDPRDLAPNGSYTGGLEAVLTGTVSTSPGAARSELAELTIEGRPRGRLFVRPAPDSPHVHELSDDPDYAAGELEQADILAAALRIDDRVERLHLEHRRVHLLSPSDAEAGVDEALDVTGDAGEDVKGSTDHEGSDHLGVEVRLVDEHGTARAEARLQLAGDIAQWTVPAGDGRMLRLRATAPTRPTYRRATRRSFHDGQHGYLVYTRPRPKAWVAVLPEDLPAPQTLLCLWLVHLVDVYAVLGRPWAHPPNEWAPVADDFPRNIGPGGFGNPNPMISGGGGMGGGS